MTEEVMEQVRKKIAKELPTTNLCEICYLHKPGNYTRKDCVTYGRRLCAYENMVVDQILSIPEILIKDPDQSLPNYITWDFGDRELVSKIHQDMIKPDRHNGSRWVKVLPKEEK